MTTLTDAQQRVNASKKKKKKGQTLFPQPFGQDLFQGWVLLVLSCVLVGVRLRCAGLVQLLEAKSLLFFACVPLGLTKLPLDGLHLFP